MPEFFDISFIGKKTSTSKSEIDACLILLGLVEGENNSDWFKGQKIIVSYFSDEEFDFEEVNIGIPEQRFTKEHFDEELEPLTNFINQCFQCNPHFEYALCSYELNGYLIGRVKRLQDLHRNRYLNRFPIIYIRSKNPLEQPDVKINFEAQDIFT